MSIGSTLGACAAFQVGRRVSRGWVEKRMSGNATFHAVSQAVGKEGFKVVLLTRLSPVFPFNVLNYAFGLTTVSFWQYALASWIGMLPGTILYVFLGSGARSLADIAAGNVQGGVVQRVFLWFGLGVTVAVTAFVARLAGRSLRQAMPDGEAGVAEGREVP